MFKLYGVEPSIRGSSAAFVSSTDSITISAVSAASSAADPLSDSALCVAASEVSEEVYCLNYMVFVTEVYSKSKTCFFATMLNVKIAL